jgi:hypothetical protein
MNNKKWSLLFAIFSMLVVFSNANAFNVGGIITTDTVWSDTSEPYMIVNPIQIAAGVTLTIEQGVIVGGVTAIIDVFGTLDVNGTAENRVLFDHVHIMPGNNSISMDNPFFIDISYAEIIGGSLYRGNGSATYGSLKLTDSILTKDPAYISNDNIYLWYPVADVQIERNIFINSDGISIGLSGNVTAIIRNNVFSGMTTGAVYNWASYGSSKTIVEFNSFMDLGATTLSLAGGDDGPAIIGANNWWGTTDTSIIDTMIYDRNDHLSVVNHIEYLPILTAPHPDTPVFEVNTQPIANAGPDQIVFDTITLDGSQSSDQEDDSLNYSWAVTNRDYATPSEIYSGNLVTISNLQFGFYDVILTVTDTDGLSGTNTMMFAATGTAPCDVRGNGKVGREPKNKTNLKKLTQIGDLKNSPDMFRLKR